MTAYYEEENEEEYEAEYEIGDKVMVASDNDNEGYDSFRNKVLIITHVATSTQDHPGYDEAMGGQGLYDLETIKGIPIGSSLYDYELEAV